MTNAANLAAVANATAGNITAAKVKNGGVTTNALAWVNFNGTGTVAIRSSYNVSSITDNGTGDYTINFTTALSDANYSFSCNAWGYSANPPDSGTPITTSSIRVITYYVSGLTGQRTSWDAQYVSVVIHGN